MRPPLPPATRLATGLATRPAARPARRRAGPPARAVGLVCLAGLGALVAPAWAHQGSFGAERMWQACEARQVDQACEFMNAAQDVYRGSCQAMSGALVCVRNQPIAYAAGSAHDHPHAPDDGPAAQGAGLVSGPGASVEAGRWPWLTGAALLLAAALGVAAWRFKRRTAA